KDRYKKEVQPKGDPDCRLGVKKGSNQNKAPDEGSRTAAATASQPPTPATPQPTRGRPGKTAKDAKGKKSDDKKEGKESLWGYGSGVASATIAGYGDVVLAELTRAFNEN